MAGIRASAAKTRTTRSASRAGASGHGSWRHEGHVVRPAGQMPLCTVCVTLWTTEVDRCKNTARAGLHVQSHGKRQELPSSPGRLSLQVRGLSGTYSLASGHPRTIHTLLWITMWMHPLQGVYPPVDNSVHNAISARQRAPSSVI